MWTNLAHETNPVRDFVPVAQQKEANNQSTEVKKSKIHFTGTNGNVVTNATCFKPPCVFSVPIPGS